MEPDLKDKYGYTIEEKCMLCKWGIERQHYLLQMKCGHRLHKKCLEVWFLEDSKCPVCFADNSIEDLIETDSDHAEIKI
jgi:hypothetical protein